MQLRVLGLVLASMTTLACVVDSSPQPTSLDLSGFDQVSAELNLADISSFHVQLYATSPPGGGAPLFDSGCFPFEGKTFQLPPVAAGADRSVRVHAFSAEDCAEETLIAVAYRGSLRVQAEADRIYTLLPYAVHDFTALPVPSLATMEKAESTECSSEDFDEGMAQCQSEVHATAFCVQGAGHCAMISLYPLNNYTPRVFAGAVALEDGQVSSLGGAGLQFAGGSFKGAETNAEVYDPSTTWFEAPYITNFTSMAPLVFHDVVHIGGQRAATIGGIEKFNLKKLGSDLVFETPVQNCGPDGSCVDNITSLLHVVDFEDQSEMAAPMPRKVFGARGILIGAGPEARVLVAGGVIGDAQGGTVEQIDKVSVCTIGEKTINCNNLDEKLSNKRFGHDVVCVDEADDGSCHRVLIVGGYSTSSQRAADFYHTESETLSSLAATEDIPMAGGWEWVVVRNEEGEQQIYSFGGTTGNLGSTANVPPYRVSLTENGLAFEELNVDHPRLHRTFHQVVALPDNTILVIGGLDKNNEVTDSVLHFSATGELLDELFLRIPRAGHTATLVTDGPLGGGVLVQGGIYLTDGSPAFVGGAEMYLSGAISQ